MKWSKYEPLFGKPKNIVQLESEIFRVSARQGEIWYLQKPNEMLMPVSCLFDGFFYLECDFSFVILSASKSWVCFGNMFLKLPSSNVQAVLQQGRCKWWELRKSPTIIELFQTYCGSMMSYLCQKCKTLNSTSGLLVKKQTVISVILLSDLLHQQKINAGSRKVQDC